MNREVVSDRKEQKWGEVGQVLWRQGYKNRSGEKLLKQLKFT